MNISKLTFVILIVLSHKTVGQPIQWNVPNRQQCGLANGSFEVINGHLLKRDQAGASIWMKQVGSGTEHIAASSSASVYGVTGQRVYKLDGNGNLMWCLNFSVPPNPFNHEPTRLGGLAISGNRLFVQEYQCPPPPIMTFATIDDGVIIIDTNGVFQGVYNKSRVTGKMEYRGCRSSPDGGVWLFNESGNSGTGVEMLHVDSLGNSYPSQYYGIQHGHYTTLADFHIMPDSTLVTATEGYFDIMVMDPPEQSINITKQQPDGTPVWSYYYSDSVRAPYGYGNYPRSLTSDSSGNIYLVSVTYRDNGTGIFDIGPSVIGLDSNGSVFLHHFWKDPPGGSWINWDLNWSDGHHVINVAWPNGHGATITLDSSYNNPCMGPVVDYTLTRTAFPVGPMLGLGSLHPVTYTPQQDTVSIQPVNSIIYQDICLLFPVGIDSPELLLDIYPNPATDELLVSSTQSIHPESIRIVDLTGRSVTPEISYARPDRVKIDVRTFQAGYYLLQCTTMDGKTSMTRFIKR